MPLPLDAGALRFATAQGAAVVIAIELLDQTGAAMLRARERQPIPECLPAVPFRSCFSPCYIY